MSEAPANGLPPEIATKFGPLFAPCPVGLEISAIGSNHGKMLILSWTTPVGRFAFLANADDADKWADDIHAKADELRGKPSIQIARTMPPRPN